MPVRCARALPGLSGLPRSASSRLLAPFRSSTSKKFEARLKRLYDAIEAGIADLTVPALQDRIAGSKAVTPEMLTKFAKAARQRIQLEGGDYRRDHLRALA